jgi:Na+/H+ antiporter NhaD/arsenite permease-like protein
MSPRALIWLIAAIATAGVVVRPFRLPEAIWAVAGTALLVALRLLSPGDALAGIAGRRRLSVPARHDGAGGNRAGGPA